MTKHRPAHKEKEEDELLLPSSRERNEPKPIVAVVGHPNVGKSTLFNRLVGKHLAIVHDEPGVTRDRHYADAWFSGRGYTLVDTGGFDPESADPMQQGIAHQVALSIAEADVVLCIFDATGGLTDADRRAVNMLRRSEKPVLYVANKADSPARVAESSDLYRLGLPELFPISALHGRGIGELESALLAKLPPLPEEDPVAPEPPSEEGAQEPIRVAVIGRPNAGKSSLVNRLTGEERVLVDSRPGTTRDPIDTLVERDGKRYVLVDTAGIRRKAKVAREESPVEAVSVLHAIRAMERCDVVVLLADASEGIAEQDAKILGLAIDRGRSVVIGLNKMDLCDAKTMAKAEERTREQLAFAPYVPIHKLSAKTGRGVTGLLKTVAQVHLAFCSRVATGKLNRFFEQVLETHPPPTMGGKAPRLYYITQAVTKPPLFVIMTNEPDRIHFSYQRYVTNQLRKEFGFEGVPIRIRYKARRKHRWPT